MSCYPFKMFERNDALREHYKLEYEELPPEKKRENEKIKKGVDAFCGLIALFFLILFIYLMFL